LLKCGFSRSKIEDKSSNNNLPYISARILKILTDSYSSYNSIFKELVRKRGKGGLTDPGTSKVMVMDVFITLSFKFYDYL
jgi:hypothetical protein